MRTFVASLVLVAGASLSACGGSDATVSQSGNSLADTVWINDSGQTLEFKGVDAIQGFAGCNTYLGQAVVDPTHITLKPQALTVVNCLSGVDGAGQVSSVMVQEDLFIKSLQSATQWRLDQKRLVLLNAQFQELQAFKPKSSSGG